ncbi:MAG: hypothetical protein IPM47_16235 [Sphingobacteriales bacterium]|nr:MAG: hypothetical protein IPM47_16235 [Sphingobacteriales bacterium]
MSGISLDSTDKTLTALKTVNHPSKFVNHQSIPRCFDMGYFTSSLPQASPLSRPQTVHLPICFSNIGLLLEHDPLYCPSLISKIRIPIPATAITSKIRVRRSVTGNMI